MAVQWPIVPAAERQPLFFLKIGNRFDNYRKVTASAGEPLRVYQSKNAPMASDRSIFLFFEICEKALNLDEIEANYSQLAQK